MMEYVIFEPDARWTTAPCVTGWRGKIDPRDICSARSRLLPDRPLLEIRPHPDTLFTDVLLSPFLLVSQLFYDVLMLYEPLTLCKEVLLIDRQNNLCELYYLPILDQYACEGYVCEGTQAHAGAYYAPERLEPKGVFQLQQGQTLLTAAGLDVAESLLRRGARGFSLRELTLEPLPFL